MTTIRRNALKGLAAVGAACIASALVTPQAAGRPGASDGLDTGALESRVQLTGMTNDLPSQESGLPVLATAD